ncbi:MAG TPA: pilus assembly protein PilP [Nevskiales bacterium]|nr:pilus assembly protein PilP [Nevskiales bacterium]
MTRRPAERIAPRRSRSILLCALLLATALGGCGGDQDDLRQYIEEVKARKTKDIEPIPQIKPYETFLYAPGARRDPFANAPAQKPLTGELGALIDPRRNREPLEEFPLDSLRLVGTLKIRDQKYALIRDPTGVVHRVTTGNYLGQNYGKITAIAETEINLREIVPDGFGGYLERQATITAGEQP